MSAGVSDRPVTTRRRRGFSLSAYLDEHPWVRRLDSPLTTYYVLLGSTLLLLLLGLVMVLSASSVTSLASGNSEYKDFISQSIFAVVGLVGGFVASRLRPTLLKRMSFLVLGIACALEAAVLFTGLGQVVNGNKNWLKLGPLGQFQPSELIKVGIIMVGATLLSTRRRELTRLSGVLVPYLVPIVLLSVGMVLYGHDLGTSLVIMGAVAGVLFVAGVPGRSFALAGILASVAALISVRTSGNRTSRIAQWLDPTCTDPNSSCGQSVHGLYALADGGVWGVGLGQSREKWGWLSEAKNDFIFAVIGEELGLWGTLTVVVLFLALAWSCYRVIARSKDGFVRIATAGIMSWIVLQTIINMCSVIGLLPVIGVPLPLISSGGSALVTTLFALGMVLSFARNEPQAREALAARPARTRSVAVLPAGIARSAGARPGKRVSGPSRASAATPTGAGRTGSSGTGSSGTGSSRTGSPRTGSSRTGSARTGSARTGAVRTGSAGTGTARTGSSRAASVRTGSSRTGSSRSGVRR